VNTFRVRKVRIPITTLKQLSQLRADKGTLKMRHVQNLILAAGLLVASPALAGSDVYAPSYAIASQDNDTKTVDSFNKTELDYTSSYSKDSHDSEHKAIDSFNQSSKVETENTTKDSNNKLEITKVDTDTDIKGSYNSRTKSESEIKESYNKTDETTIKDSYNKTDKTVDSYNKTEKTIDSYNKTDKTIDSYNKSETSLVNDSYNKTEKTEIRDSYNDKSTHFTLIAPVSEVELRSTVSKNDVGVASGWKSEAKIQSSMTVSNAMNGTVGVSATTMNTGANVSQQATISMPTVVAR
jgi:hypothetical protein